MTNAWPAGVPSSLWSYNLLTITEKAQFPMLGISFAPGFLVAFGFGSAFLAVFSWQRFKSDGGGAGPSAYRVLKELQPGDLGGSGALARAYFLYLTALLVAYTALTFFGKLILSLASVGELAGISVDVGKLKFDSPQWPLMLAFGIAGLADLLPPLKLAETWLRQRAFRAVGIPVRIQQTTRDILCVLRRASGPGTREDILTKRLTERVNEVRALIETSAPVRDLLGSRSMRRDDLERTVAELEMLIDWARSSRGAWPDSGVSDRARALEARLVDEAEKLLNEFLKRVAEATTTMDEARRERLNQYLSDFCEKAHGLRDDLVALLATYIERDPDIDLGPVAPEAEPIRIKDPALRDLVKQAEPPNLAGSGPETGVLVAMVVVFLVYAILVWQELHPLLSQVAETSNPRAVLITGGVETLRVLSLVWLPLLAAFATRQYLIDNREWVYGWEPLRSARYVRYRVTALSIALGVSVLGLVGVALLWAFAISESPARFNELLLQRPPPFLLFIPGQALMVVPLILTALWAADLRAARVGGVATVAFAGSMVVGFCVLLQLRFWSRSYWPCQTDGLAGFFDRDCFSRNGGIDLVVLPLLTFLAAAMFGDPQPPPRRHVVEGPAAGRPGPGALAAAAVIVAALLLVAADASAGGDPEMPVVVADVDRPVVLGFRRDAEPFSFRTRYDRGKANERPYSGYISDLCYQIFDGGPYEFTETEVDATDRFDRMRPSPHHTPIDVLCDPVTLRPSDEKRRGIYSPIVFASGVSFLERKKPGDVVIGYVGGTTAQDVALRACRIDLFGEVLPRYRGGMHERCRLAFERANLPQELPAADAIGNMDTRAITSLIEGLRSEGLSDRYLEACPSVLTDAEPPEACKTMLALAVRAMGAGDCEETKVVNPPIYRFCQKDTHDKLVAWFCSTTSAHLVYVGDRELIVGKLQRWEEDHGSCGVERPQGADFLSYEPYALLVTAERPKLVQFVQRRVYEIFSHRAGADALFTKHFPGAAMSDALAYLFLLNAVENEQRFVMPEEPPQEAAAAR